MKRGVSYKSHTFLKPPAYLWIFKIWQFPWASFHHPLTILFGRVFWYAFIWNIHCPVSNNGFSSVWFWLVTVLFYLLFCLWVFSWVIFIRNREFDGRIPSVFVKERIHDLVASIIFIDIDNLLGKICKIHLHSLSYIKQQRRKPMLSAFEIFNCSN